MVNWTRQKDAPRVRAAASKPGSMASIDKRIDRTLFWAACFMDTDCPPADVAGFEIVTTFTVSATVESFDAATLFVFIK